VRGEGGRRPDEGPPGGRWIQLLLLQSAQPRRGLLVVRVDLEHVVVAGLGARDQAFHLVEISEGDQRLDVFGIDRESSLIAFRRVTTPVWIALLTRAEELPGLGVIRRELNRLLEQHDRAVVILFGRKLPGFVEVLLRESLNVILRRIDEALATLKDQSRRAAYDKLLHGRRAEGATSLQQRLNQRSIAGVTLPLCSDGRLGRRALAVNSAPAILPRAQHAQASREPDGRGGRRYTEALRSSIVVELPPPPLNAKRLYHSQYTKTGGIS